MLHVGAVQSLLQRAPLSQRVEQRAVHPRSSQSAPSTQVNEQSLPEHASVIVPPSPRAVQFPPGHENTQSEPPAQTKSHPPARQVKLHCALFSQRTSHGPPVHERVHVSPFRQAQPAIPQEPGV